MKTATRTLMTAAAVAALLVGATDADAGHRRSRQGSKHWRSAWSPMGSGYGVFKAGGYGLDAAVQPQGQFESLFLGAEVGTAVSPNVQIGFTLDWLRRRNATSEVFLLDTPYELPVQGVLNLESSSTDLIPMGGLIRLRFPVGDGTFVPFVSGQLTYDLLRLEYQAADTQGPFTTLQRQTDYFHGLGTTVSLGVEAALDPQVGVMFEVGIHDSEPSNNWAVGGSPVDARVDAGGEFLRVGLRIGLS